MKNTSLDQFIQSIQRDWTGLNTQTIVRTRELLHELANASIREPWLAAIHKEKPETVELYSDAKQGFLLLAHTEEKGMYRPPHDHGEGWVFYAVQHGESTMSTYKAITIRTGDVALVTRGAYTMSRGDCSVFLPRDVHDTRCESEYLVQFRLTSCDFSKERKEGRMIQYEKA